MNLSFFSTLRLLIIIVVVIVTAASSRVYGQSNTTTTTSPTVPFCVGPLCNSLLNMTWVTPPTPPPPDLSIPDQFATPMLWAAGPVSIMAMLFGGSPVNGLYSTSALAIVEFSICYRDLVDQPLRFPESAWPGVTIGRQEGQHIRGALVANVTMQVTLVIVLFVIGIFISSIQRGVKTRRNRSANRLAMSNNGGASGGGGNSMPMLGGGKNGSNPTDHGDDDDDLLELNANADGTDSSSSNAPCCPKLSRFWKAYDRASIAVWYPGSYILVSSIFLEGIVASVIRLFIIGPDWIDVILSIIGLAVVAQIMVVAWTVVSQSFHGAGPVRFCSAYVRVDKKYHESAITQFLRSKTASTFLLGNYLWCAKKGTEDSRRNVLPGKARPAGLLVLPFRARNPEESGVIALATRYFFVECCFAFVFAICRGVFDPCEVNIWVIACVSFMSTLTLVRVRPFNIPFYNTTAVWSNGAVTASAVCIALYHTQGVGENAKLAGEVIAMMAALGGALPFALYLIRVVLLWLVNAELAPVGLQEEQSSSSASQNSPRRNADASGFFDPVTGVTTANGKSVGGENSSKSLNNLFDGTNKGDGSSPNISASSPGSASGGRNNNSNNNNASLEDDLELEAILSSEKQPVTWPLRKANDLRLPPLPRADYVDDGSLFVRKNDKREERPSIFSPEGQMERERLKQRRPRLPELLATDDVILPIPIPSQNITNPTGSNRNNNNNNTGSALGNNNRMSMLNNNNNNNAGSPRIASQPGINVNNNSPSPSSPSSFRSSQGVPNLPKQGTSPLMEAYVV